MRIYLLNIFPELENGEYTNSSLFSRSGLEVLVGSTIKKKWSKIKNRILKMNTETTDDYSWVPLIDEKTISITYLNIKMQSER